MYIIACDFKLVTTRKGSHKESIARREMEGMGGGGEREGFTLIVHIPTQ